MYVKKVIKIGDSIGFTLPSIFRHALDIKRGDFLVIVLGHNDNLIIKKITKEEQLLFQEKNIQYD